VFENESILASLQSASASLFNMNVDVVFYSYFDEINHVNLSGFFKKPASSAFDRPLC